MTQRAKPPLETVATARGSSLASLSLAVLACALVAALFGADAMLTWTERLPIHPISDWLVERSVEWRSLMQATGLGDVAASVRRWFRILQQ
jgi:hypothetical protein